MKQARHYRSYRYRQSPGARRDRPADHPEETEPALFAVAGSVRFGSPRPTRANAFNAGIKGRYKETQIDDDHQLKNSNLSGAQAGRWRDPRRVDEPGAGPRSNIAPARRFTRLDWRQRACCAGNKVDLDPQAIISKLTLPNVALPPPDRASFRDIHATPRRRP